MKQSISLRKSRRVAGHFRWTVLLACVLSAPLLATQPDRMPMPGDYRVIAGRVDAGTYAGWRAFHATCYACHGVGGVGTTAAPNLVARIGSMTPRAFAAKVLASYRIVAPDEGSPTDKGASTPDTMLEQIMRRERGNGGRVIMPEWEGDARVDPHVLDLYAYLSARADGKIGPGQPRRARDVKR